MRSRIVGRELIREGRPLLMDETETVFLYIDTTVRTTSTPAIWTGQFQFIYGHERGEGIVILTFWFISRKGRADQMSGLV